MCDIIIKLRFYSIAFSMNITIFFKRRKRKKIKGMTRLCRILQTRFQKSIYFKALIVWLLLSIEIVVLTYRSSFKDQDCFINS